MLVACILDYRISGCQVCGNNPSIWLALWAGRRVRRIPAYAHIYRNGTSDAHGSDHGTLPVATTGYHDYKARAIETRIPTLNTNVNSNSI